MYLHKIKMHNFVILFGLGVIRNYHQYLKCNRNEQSVFKFQVLVITKYHDFCDVECRKTERRDVDLSYILLFWASIQSKCSIVPAIGSCGGGLRPNNRSDWQWYVCSMHVQTSYIAHWLILCRTHYVCRC